MIASLASIFLASVQATYGPPVPPTVRHAAPTPSVAEEAGSADFVALLRAQGLSDAGARALSVVPAPTIARGATRAAQCTVEQLTRAEPLPVDELSAALAERDATQAAQAQETTRYLVAALAVLPPADQRLLLQVLGTQEDAVGGPPPPRPEGVRVAGEGQGRGRGGAPGGPGGPGGPGAPRGAGDRKGPQGGARGGPPPGGAGAPRVASACEALLG